MQNAVGDAEYLFDDSITHISENASGVYVEFENHKPRTFDLCVGADGLHSKVRKLAFGDESNFSQDFGVYVSVFSFPNFLGLTDCEIEHFSLRKFVSLYRDRNDVSAKAAIAFSTPKSFHSRDREDQQKLIEEVFADSGWEMPRILAAMKDSPDFYFDFMAQIHMPHGQRDALH